MLYSVIMDGDIRYVAHPYLISPFWYHIFYEVTIELKTMIGVGGSRLSFFYVALALNRACLEC